MLYALVKDSTTQVFRLGNEPAWKLSPPPGFSVSELENNTIPDPGTPNDPVDNNGKLLLGDFGIVTVENKEMRRMSNAEIDSHILADLKSYRYRIVNKKTDELLEEGFEYPASSGKTFALDLVTQLRVLGSDYVRELPQFAYPVTWNTVDDTGKVEIPTPADMRQFFLTGLTKLRTTVDSGTAIKEQIRAATNAADVLAINDPR